MTRTYLPLICAVGEVVTCARRGEVAVSGWNARGWPTCRAGGRNGTLSESVILAGDLLDALREEPAGVVAELVGVGRDVVSVWRKSVGVPRFNPGTTRIWREAARRKLHHCDRAAPSVRVPSPLAVIAGRLSEMARIYWPPCVYFLLEHGEVVYVGQTTHLPARIESHRSGPEIKSFDRVVYLPVPERDLLTVEGEWIRQLQPKYNGRAVQTA